MALQIIEYPHPTLRHKSKPLKRIDAELVKMIDEMFELMHEHDGIGLAANQVDLPYRLFVLNLSGRDRDPEQRMVFINPVITKRKGTHEGEEGCLSIPGVWEKVRRAEEVTVTAYNLQGQEVTYEAKGLFAKAVQHELDHLDGVLFIDRLTETGKLSVKESLREFEEKFIRMYENGELPDELAMMKRIADLEKLRT
ncbi:MAG TPA: peptide deformylase [Pirellulales bacterium]